MDTQLALGLGELCSGLKENRQGKIPIFSEVKSPESHVYRDGKLAVAAAPCVCLERYTVFGDTSQYYQLVSISSASY